MPLACKTPCRQQGCAALVYPPGHCDQHRKQRDAEYNTARRARGDEKDGLYKTPAWKRVSAMMRRLQPLCVDCKQHGIVTAATECDHIVPIKQGGAWYDPTNLQMLCKPCHSRKSAREGSRWHR